MSPPAEPRYTHEQWNALLERSIAEIRRLSVQKGGEYAGDQDRLANFRRNARALGQEPELVWAVYAGKHWDAIQQYCRDLAQGVARIRAEPISGRLDDLIVCALLLKAMVEEREGAKPRALPAPQRVEPPSHDPECPRSGRDHDWGQMDRWTDICRACGPCGPIGGARSEPLG